MYTYTKTLKLEFFLTVIFILGGLSTIRIVTIHDTYCSIFVLQYIVA